MAQLHRRIPRFPYRLLVRGRALATVALCCAAPLSRTRAEATEPGRTAQNETAPSVNELVQLGHALGGANADVRRQAHDTLLKLGDDALTAIEARLAQLDARLDTEGALRAVCAFRRVQGVSSPSAEVDLLLGVLPVLGRERTRATTDAAELVLLLRALEAQKTPAAAQIIVGQLFAVEPKLFRYEAARSRDRLGVIVLPALIRHRAHVKPFIRQFCVSSLEELHMETPGRAVQQNDVALLAAILSAYGDTLTFDAMPVIVSYLTDERVAVREAAARAIRRFGKNAIWQLRERYLNATGLEPHPDWGHLRILDELYAVHDEPKKRTFQRELGLARDALAAGDLTLTSSALSRALAAEPQSGRARAAAPLYAELGARHLSRRDLEASLTAYRRALRLSLDGRENANLQARVRYLQAELRLQRGVVDIEGYQRALNLDPSLEEAVETLSVVSGAKGARERLWRRIVGLFAAFIMLVAALALLRSPSHRPNAPARSGDGGARPPPHS